MNAYLDPSKAHAGSAEAEPLFAPASDLCDLPVPPRQWHVRGLIPGGTVTMLGGDGGAGKSTAALQLAVATATGDSWLGRPIERPGAAMFLSAEDDRDELHRRFSAICAAVGATFDDLDKLLFRSLAGEDALLAVPDRRTNALVPTPLYHALDAAMAAEPPAVLVLDTLADLTAGDENSRTDARQFIGMLRHLAITHDCAVVLLAHPSLTGLSNGTGLSGSTAWNASVRSRLYMERITEDGYEPDPDARRLSAKKANYARTGDEIRLTWRAGAFVADDVAPGGLDGMALGARAERVFLKLLRQFTEQGRHVSASTSSTYAPAVFSKHPDAEGISKRALSAAMEALFSRNAIEVRRHGKGAKARSHIAECDGVQQ